MRSLILVCVFFQLCFDLNGQLLATEVISSSGGLDSNIISLQWTIGESIVDFIENEESVALTQGFHQIFIIDRDLQAEAEIRADIFPNPSMNRLSISVDNDGIIFYRLIDENGKLLQSSGSFEEKFDLDVSSYPSGVYFLNLQSNESKFYRTYKLIKQ